ncbi:MAG TPA: CrcB family protein [Pirellulales bacterium]|jgi:CrcB protein|nr:CrcB family protein [Pirellulales bacterium]
MKTCIDFLAIGAAGFLGAMVRYLVALLSVWAFGVSYGFVGTMIINITGSLFLGWFVVVTEARIVLPGALKLAIGVGFVGAYTTFSTFCVDSMRLMEGAAYNKFAVNVLGSVLIGLIAARLGMRLAGR